MLTVLQAAAKLGLSDGRIRQLLLEGRIKGATKFGSAWMVPDNPVISKPKKPRGGQPAQK